MWDDPRSLNAASAALAALAVALLVFAVLELLIRSSFFPLRELTIEGKLENITRIELEDAARPRLNGNFFAVRPSDVRAGLEGLAWVRRADVRRVWPDRLAVALEEHKALAHWGDDALVNTHGERFIGRSDALLPLFAGPAGTERLVTERYRVFARALAPLGADVRQLVLTPRYAWQIRLSNGLEIVLGREGTRDRVEARLARFVESYPSTLGRITGKHAYVDLRYPNGYALRVPGVDREARKSAVRS